MFLITRLLPQSINNILFGKRNDYGTKVNTKDKDWIEWLKIYNDFYAETQKKGVGSFVNNSGYKILKEVDVTNKTILEIGPGSMHHLKYLIGTPKKYIIADVQKFFLQNSKTKLDNKNITNESIYISDRNSSEIDGIEKNSIDIIVTFYSLEHLYKLKDNLLSYNQYLTEGGMIVGTVPCEGGLAWGFGRMLTSRRWMKKNTNIDPDKIICWEHPNFVSDIKFHLDNIFKLKKQKFFPFNITNGDFNLLFSFIYTKKNQSYD